MGLCCEEAIADVSRGETGPSADLGGSSKYSHETTYFEGRRLENGSAATAFDRGLVDPKR